MAPALSAERCRHELPLGTCATCRGDALKPEDRLQEAIDAAVTYCTEERCGAAIVWATTVNGRRMPVDYEVSEAGTIELVLHAGELHCFIHHAPKTAGPGQSTLGPELELRTSHFVTCTHPDSFRRTR